MCPMVGYLFLFDIPLFVVITGFGEVCLREPDSPTYVRFIDWGTQFQVSPGKQMNEYSLNHPKPQA